ncbi:uncharacterized protein LOC114535302 [Dendronephthya gigantea]|uniref:uncharacterized protein LOC114535302 n=1 Tax=Dendronephthya gigantea TaxID=151771 RepID=UPI0010697D53|nr:uncharacterized protein LOC114535302 [Dendronephthya gigantea]
MSGTNKVKKCEGVPRFKNNCDVSMIAGHKKIPQSEGLDVWCLSLLYIMNTSPKMKAMNADEMRRYYDENIEGKCQKQFHQEILGHWISLKNAMTNLPKSELENIPSMFLLKIMEAFEDKTTKLKFLQIFLEICPCIPPNNNTFEKESVVSKMPVVDEEDFSALTKREVSSPYCCSSNAIANSTISNKKRIETSEENPYKKISKPSEESTVVVQETDKTNGDFGSHNKHGNDAAQNKISREPAASDMTATENEPNNVSTIEVSQVSEEHYSMLETETELGNDEEPGPSGVLENNCRPLETSQPSESTSITKKFNGGPDNVFGPIEVLKSEEELASPITAETVQTNEEMGFGEEATNDIRTTETSQDPGESTSNMKRDQSYGKIGPNCEPINDEGFASTIMIQTIQNNEKTKSNEEAEEKIETTEVSNLPDVSITIMGKNTDGINGANEGESNAGSFELSKKGQETTHPKQQRLHFVAAQDIDISQLRAENSKLKDALLETKKENTRKMGEMEEKISAFFRQSQHQVSRLMSFEEEQKDMDVKLKLFEKYKENMDVKLPEIDEQANIILERLTEVLSNFVPDSNERIIRHVRDRSETLCHLLDELPNRRQGLADMQEL